MARKLGAALNKEDHVRFSVTLTKVAHARLMQAIKEEQKTAVVQLTPSYFFNRYILEGNKKPLPPAPGEREPIGDEHWAARGKAAD